MSQGEPGDRRGRDDRRESDAPWWDPRRLRGRRGRNRRAEEDAVPYLVDRVSAPAFAAATSLLVLTLADGLMTVALLDQGCEEANPVMRYLLGWGVGAFFVGKYALTAVFLPVALVTYRYRLFGTRVRVGHLVPVVAVLYLVLIAYQYGLWRQTLGDRPTAGAGGAAAAR